MKTLWHKSDFTITNSSGPKRVEGLIHCSGHFALEKGSTRITHLPTGLLISPSGLTFSQAKLYAEKLAELPFDWGTLTAGEGQGQEINGRPFREVIWDTVAEVQGII